MTLSASETLRRSALATAVYALTPEGTPTSVADIHCCFPRSAGVLKHTIRSWLVKLAKARLLVRTRKPRKNTGIVMYHREGAAVSTDEVLARLHPPKPKREKKAKRPGGMCSVLTNEISEWAQDQHGNLTRTVTSVESPEVVAAMKEAGRLGGEARARKAEEVRARKAEARATS